MSAVARLVPERLRVVQRSLLTRRGGRISVARSAVHVDYKASLLAKYRGNYSDSPHMIDAEHIHGDESQFWTERRSFYRSGASRNFLPIWDRQSQVLVMLTRHVPRVPQEAAFRLFAVFLKMLLLPRLTAWSELMLPMWLMMNAEGLLSEAKNKSSKEGDVRSEEAEVPVTGTSATVEKDETK